MDSAEAPQSSMFCRDACRLARRATGARMLSDVALARSDHVPVHGIVIVMVRSRLAVLEAVRTLIVDSGF